MIRRRETIAYLCTIVLALTCVAAKPKSKQRFKPVRPMEIPDGISEVRKAEPVAPPPGSVSKIAPITRSAAVMVIDARTGEILTKKMRMRSGRQPALRNF
jgi:D-alanyl-D-alanine carboxypeptidase